MPSSRKRESAALLDRSSLQSFGYQSGSIPSPPPASYRGGGGGGDEGNLSGDVTQQFVEPAREAPPSSSSTPSRVSPASHAPRSSTRSSSSQSSSSSDIIIFGYTIPRPLVRFVCRIRNTLAIYNFFFIYGVNALLNIEIYREYVRRSLKHVAHPSSADVSGLEHKFHEQSILQSLYIVTLAAPLGDMLSRIVARNYFKLCLAKSMSHASFAASLAICTPSLNAYALLILRGSARWIPVIMALDIGEVVYSGAMLRAQSAGLDALNHPLTPALLLKFGMLVISLGMFLWDCVTMFQLRRFILHKRLPPHLAPVYVVWDVNEQFRWSSLNSICDLLEEHEDVSSGKNTSWESKERRKMIQLWSGEGGMITESDGKFSAAAQADSADDPLARLQQAEAQAAAQSINGGWHGSRSDHTRIDAHDDDECDVRSHGRAEDTGALLGGNRR